jgi:hypothetical protein
MNTSKNIFIIGMLLCIQPYIGHAASCSFTLPPNEQVVINGHKDTSRTMDCRVEDNGLGNDYLLNFISELNTSVVNNLIMPEGTIMSLSLPPKSSNELCFKLKPRAKLGITNDTADFLRVRCN